jgi:hypothetical protein
LTSAQLGDTITFEVTASNAGGSGVPATSAATSAVINATHALATAWSAQVVTNGGAAPSNATVLAISNFCYALDAASLTAKIKEMNVFAPDNSVATSTPLIITLGLQPWSFIHFVAGDFSINGVKGNGTNKFVNIGGLLSGIVTQTSVSACVYCNGAGNTNTELMGVALANGALRMAWNPATGNYICAYDGGKLAQAANTTSYFSGYVCGTKVSSSVRNLYLANSTTPHNLAATNNIVDSVGSDVVPANPTFLFAGDEGGLDAAWYSGTISFASIGLAFTAADSLAMYNAVQALRVAFGGGFI